MKAAYCTCQSGRELDGSEFGPCPACERADDEERIQAAIKRDAARWRVSQIKYPPQGYADSCGFFEIDRESNGYAVGIQPHPATGSLTINQCIMGEGADLASAIDGLFLSLNAYVEEGAVLEPQLEAARALAIPA